jgi:riboflavin kinase
MDYSQLATLKHLAKKDAISQEIKVTGSTLAEELEISTQTVSRRMNALADAGLIYRQPLSNGQHVFIREDGKRLLEHEYEEYRAIFDPDPNIEFTGEVVDGMNEGQHYLSLEGYQSQFEDKLGYRPYAGTLNIRLDMESIRTRRRLGALEPIRIEEWQGEDRTYGAVFCYPGELAGEHGSYESVHAIVPERTHYDEDQLELVGPVQLRDELDLTTGSHVRVTIHRT